MFSMQRSRVPHPTKARHRQVIDQDGNTLEDTRSLGRLRFAAGVSRRAVDELPAADPRTAPSGILPVHGYRTIAMRVPVTPKPKVTLADRFPRSFFDDPAFVSQLAQVQVGVHHAAHDMCRAFNVRMQALVRRAREVSTAWRYEGTATLGHDLAAAYAEGGTERLLALTPQVLAEMDARAKAAAR